MKPKVFHKFHLFIKLYDKAHRVIYINVVLQILELFLKIVFPNADSIFPHIL